MSKGDKNNSDNTSFDTILKSLANRPNVQHTIVLSRRDGSIIRTTGFKDIPAASTSYADGAEPASSVENNNERPATSRSTDSSALQQAAPVVSPAERLAHSIYAFVKVSESLASSLSESQSMSDGFENTSHAGTGRAPAERSGINSGESNIENQVQLLRMRTKKQEIIIFPDSNYLCCVVSNVGRGSNLESGR